MSIWESVSLTVVGGVVAAAAGLLGAAVQARQAAQARRDQEKREDRYRLHQDRLATYVAFHLCASDARAILQDLVDDDDEDDAQRRAVRNETQGAYAKVVLLGGAEVIVAARRIMVFIDGVVYRREPFDSGAWSDVIGSFQEAARYDLTGHRDLADIWARHDWPAPPPRRSPDAAERER
ncbi:hypothetical protein [Micromonospora sp. NPDC004704]